jgi:hypothetical protein
MYRKKKKKYIILNFFYKKIKKKLSEKNKINISFNFIKKKKFNSKLRKKIIIKFQIKI